MTRHGPSTAESCFVRARSASRLPSIWFYDLMRTIHRMACKMTEVELLARFVDQRQFGDISAEARQQLKIRVLDTIGVAIGALDAPPILAVSRLLDELGGTPLSTLI